MTLALIASMLGGLGMTASAAPINIGAGFHITTGGTYQIDSGTINGIIFIDTNQPVTLLGSGTADPTTPTNEALSIECTVPGVQLTLDSVFIGSPFEQGNVIHFVGSGNTLTQVPGIENRSILEAVGFPNLTIVHVGPSAELTFLGSETSRLYMFKNSGSSAIGGNTLEAGGVINFNSGNIYVKGSGQGAVIGGNDLTVGSRNGAISINGGHLSVAAMAQGAAIGSSQSGQSAGDVFINGGSTLINVNFAGSAIGRGGNATVTNTGDLYLNEGSLKTVVNAPARETWNIPPGPDDISSSNPITANIHYGETAEAANTVPVNISGLNLLGHLNAVIYPRGLNSSVAYDEFGLNRNDFSNVITSTPPNWSVNPLNTSIYLGAPLTGLIGIAGYISVTGSGGAVQNYSYTQVSAPPNFFEFTSTLLASNVNIVGFNTTTATVSITGQPAGTTVMTVNDGGSVSFTVTPQVPSSTILVTVNGTPITPVGGVYTINNIQANQNVVVTEIPATAYNVHFAPGPYNVRVNGQFVTEAEIAAGGTLLFDVVLDPATALDMVTVAPSGTITHVGGGTYQLSGVTSNVTVTIDTHPIPSFPVHFNLANAQALVNGVAVVDTQIPQDGEFLFEVVADFGYAYDPLLVMASGATLTHLGGNLFELTNPTGPLVMVTLPTSMPVSGFWTNTTGGTWGGTGSSTTPYIISDALGLARLMREVNAGTTFAGQYFVLGDDINLVLHEWVPIGGTHNLTIATIPAPLANTKYFAGSFDGAGHTVSGIRMTIPAANTGSAGYGLFGYVNGGTISNLTVRGVIESNQAIDAVGGVVGYTTGDLRDLVNEVRIAIINNNSSQVGGIAGVVSATGSNTVSVLRSANVVDISGSSRLGGVIGATYRTASSHITVDGVFNTGEIHSPTPTNGRTLIGGVVGLGMGTISNSYNTGDISLNMSAANAYSVGGIAGVLTGAVGFPSSMHDVYSTGVITGPDQTGLVIRQLQPLWGSNDFSPYVSVANGLHTHGVQQHMNANVTNVHLISDPNLRSQVALQTLVSGAFAQYASTYPVLTWQTITLPTATVADLNAAMAAATPAVNTIVVNGTIPVGAGANLTIDIGEKGAQIVRGAFVGNLIGVTAGNLTVISGTIDGNISGTTTGVAINSGAPGAGTVTLSPAVGEPFRISGIINLAASRYIDVTATLANIEGSITITSTPSTSGRVVARAMFGYAFTPADLAKFAYSGGIHTFVIASGGSEIAIA